MNLRLATSMAVILALQPACDEAARPEARSENPVATASTRSSLTAQRVRVTRDRQRGPQSCSPREVGELVVDLFASAMAMTLRSWSPTSSVEPSSMNNYISSRSTFNTSDRGIWGMSHTSSNEPPTTSRTLTRSRSARVLSTATPGPSRSGACPKTHASSRLPPSVRERLHRLVLPSPAHVLNQLAGFG